MYRLPFDDAEFDTIVLDDVLTDAKHPVRVLREARRLLKPAGRLFVLLGVSAQHQFGARQLPGLRVDINTEGFGSCAVNALVPIRWLSKARVIAAIVSGAMNDVALPHSAYRPKNSPVIVGGARRASMVRLADCAGDPALSGDPHQLLNWRLDIVIYQCPIDRGTGDTSVIRYREWLLCRRAK